MVNTSLTIAIDEKREEMSRVTIARIDETSWGAFRPGKIRNRLNIRCKYAIKCFIFTYLILGMY